MTAADATDLFLARRDRAENRTTADIDALAVGGALGLHAPTIFAPVHELKVRGWIAAAGVDCPLGSGGGNERGGQAADAQGGGGDGPALRRGRPRPRRGRPTPCARSA